MNKTPPKVVVSQDRKNRKLEFDDILHYQKIIVALTETKRLMREVDKVGI